MFLSKRLFQIYVSSCARRLTIVTFICGLLFLLYIATSQNERRGQVIKRFAPTIFDDVFFADVKPPPGRSIFFLETKCKWTEEELDSNSEYYNLNFTAHQACSIESAAFHNPNYEVFVLFACPTLYTESHPIIEALKSYRNVKFRNINLFRYAANTSIANWLKTDALFKSSYLMYNISDLLRILTLYHFGGTYFDMDVLLLRSFEDEPLNFVGAETSSSVGNSVISLEPDGAGHNIAQLFLSDYQNNFNGEVWAHNGPMSLVRVMTAICGTKDVKLMDPKRCQGMKVYSVNAFYEINWLQWQHFFEPEHANSTLERVKTSYAIHLWNHVNDKWPISVESKAAYIQLAAQHCPRVFKATGAYFN